MSAKQRHSFVGGGLSMTKLLTRLLLTSVASCGLMAAGGGAVAAPVKSQHHHDAKRLLGANIKRDGHHEIEHKGKYTTSVDVEGGKIAAWHVRHSENGDLPVKKYKTTRLMARSSAPNLMLTSYRLAQMQDLGTEYIGFSYVDDEGNEEIYWFPVEEVYDGDTGAVEYVPPTS